MAYANVKMMFENVLGPILWSRPEYFNIGDGTQNLDREAATLLFIQMTINWM